jgi:hypothetical protein
MVFEPLKFVKATFTTSSSKQRKMDKNPRESGRYCVRATSVVFKTLQICLKPGCFKLVCKKVGFYYFLKPLLQNISCTLFGSLLLLLFLRISTGLIWRVLLDSGFKQKVKKARGNQGKIFIFVTKKHQFAKITCLTYLTQKMEG